MTIKVIAIGRMPGNEEWQNVFHFAGADADGADGDSAADQVVDFYTALASELSNGWHFDRMKIGAATGPIVREEVIESMVGGVSGKGMPNDVAILIKWFSVEPSRNGKGRTYIGGSHSAQIERGDSTGAAIVGAAMSNTVAAAAGGLTGDASNPLQVFSRVNGVGYSVTGGLVDRRYATQRRRDLDTSIAGLPFT